MPLSNVLIKNFRQDNVAVNHVASQLVDGVIVPDSNTLPKSALITMEAAGGTENPNGGALGYWSFCTKNLKISGFMGESSNKWLKRTSDPLYGWPDNDRAYWTNTSCRLKDTEFDPGGGGGALTINGSPGGYNGFSYDGVNPGTPVSFDYRIGHDFWKANLEYEPGRGVNTSYFKGGVRYWKNPDNYGSANYGSSGGCTAGGNCYGDPTGNYADFTIAGYESEWPSIVKEVVAVDSKPRVYGYGVNSGQFEDTGTYTSQIIGQQNNKVFIVVIFKDDVTGQDILDAEQEIVVNFDGEPVFVQWDGIPPVPDGENSAVYNVSSDSDIQSYPDGGNADEVGVNGSEQQSFELSIGEEEENNGEAGLLLNEINSGSNNQSAYDALAAAGVDSPDVDYNQGNADGY